MRTLGVQRVFISYETLASTGAAAPLGFQAFVANLYVDITPYIAIKIDITLYRTELQPVPLPRGPAAIRALARFRGATVGVESAETFVLVCEVRYHG